MNFQNDGCEQEFNEQDIHDNHADEAAVSQFSFGRKSSFESKRVHLHSLLENRCWAN